MQNKVDQIADSVKIDVNLIHSEDILNKEIEEALAKSKVINS